MVGWGLRVLTVVSEDSGKGKDMNLALDDASMPIAAEVMDIAS